MGNQQAEEFEDGGLKNQPLLEIVETNKFESLALIPQEESKEILINLKKQVQHRWQEQILRKMNKMSNSPK